MNLRWPALALLSVFLATPASTATTPSSRLVEEVGTAYLEWEKQDDLFLRLKFGLPVEKLPDVSAAEVERDAALAAALRERLAPVVTADLTHEETLSLDILRRQLGAWIEAPRLHWFSFPVTPYASPIGGVNRVFSTWQFTDDKSAAAYLELVRQLPGFYGGLRTKLEAQAVRGIRIPKPELDLVVPFLRSQIGPNGDPEKGPYGVAPGRLTALAPTRVAALRADLSRILETQLIPPLRAFTDWLDGDYRAAAPEAVGLGQYPGGPEAYAWLVRWHTTLDVQPEEVHRIGQARVAAIEAEMAALRQRIGFAGTPAEFRQKLKTDPRLFPKTPEEIGERLMAHIRRIEPQVEAFFLRRPKAPYGVRRLAPELEPGQTFGFYNPPTAGDASGTYYFNGSQLADRSLLNAAGLIYHELVPGHHFQITLAYENDGLPAFRRETFDTAYTEGWGEYASELAGEMGMYSDPYDQYGRLAMEMFVTTRLVVDTGMNALGWSRDRAMAFMREHLMETDTQIQTESLRYSCDIPGQALAYKMGALRIRELRERARAALGPAFDVRRFHDAVLGSGSLPMDALERHVDAFVAAEKRRQP